MRKIYLALFLVIGLVAIGCGSVAEKVAGDINGWDISACVSGFDTCWDLYKDNESKFDNDFVVGMEKLTDGD